MRNILQTTMIFLLVTAGFIALNNIPIIPWNIMWYLWFGWFPCFAMITAFCYGLTACRSGGSMLFVAAFFIPMLYLSTKYAFPFASLLANIPTIIASAFLTLPLEICGRNIKRKYEKRTSQN